MRSFVFRLPNGNQHTISKHTVASWVRVHDIKGDYVGIAFKCTSILLPWNWSLHGYVLADIKPGDFEDAMFGALSDTLVVIDIRPFNGDPYS